jgi:hypothetical protein
MEMEQIQEGKNDFFRKRGGADAHEFFAVALENFFERPEEFQKRKPLLFTVLVKLMRQNPIVLKQS